MNLFRRRSMSSSGGGSAPKICLSLGTGELSMDGESVERFVPSNPNSPSAKMLMSSSERGRERSSPNSFSAAVISKLQDLESSSASPCSTPKKGPSRRAAFNRSNSSFLRVTDLNMDAFPSTVSSSLSSSPSSSCAGEDDEDLCCNDMVTPSPGSDEDAVLFVPNYHHAAVDPPPGVVHDPVERWVALDDGDGSHAPIAPVAIHALAQWAQDLVLHRTDDFVTWTPESKTGKWIEQHPQTNWSECTWTPPPSHVQDGEKACWKLLPPAKTPEEERVLIWMGTLGTGRGRGPYYGSDLPLIRASGIVNTSAHSIVELLLDSSRVQEYNKISLGRHDKLVLQDSMDTSGPFGGVTKIIRSESRVMRSTLQFNTLFHARKVDAGYLVLTRAVEVPPPPGHDASSGNSSALKSEVLLGLNLIWHVDDQRCLLVTLNHIRSPMIPVMIGKRIGLQAAASFFADLRGCFPCPIPPSAHP